MGNCLVHACCGPCACVFDAAHLFFNGDNFDTREEYERRRDAVIVVCPSAVIEPYNPCVFESCAECIKYRLQRCADYARTHGFDCFTTSLTVSPHKNAAMINEIGRAVAAQFGISFIEMDLKKGGGFTKSVARSRELGIYRQKYCGCARSVVK